VNAPARRRHAGNATSVILIIVIVLAAAIAAALWMRAGFAAVDDPLDAKTFTVSRGSFDITIPCSGELAALRQVEVRNQLESRAVITYIAPEGKYVRRGEELIHLSEEEILNEIKDMQDSVNNAEAGLIAAQASLQIRRSARDSAIDQARLNVELSRLALQGWLEGDVVSTLERLSLDWEAAQINYKRLAEKYLDSIELEKQGFIATDQLKLDEIAMINARAALDQANRAVSVYARYDYPQDEARMESAVEQALAEFERIRRRHVAEIQSAESEVESRAYQLESRRQRLEELRLQHSYCSVIAPTDGLVVYASSMETGGHHRGNDQPPPQVGTELRPNELVMMLPDTSEMLAAVKVNEALSGLVEPGQHAIVISDALPETSLVGSVLSIGVLAESGGYRDPNRRDYTVRILLETPEGHGLKPSMRCKADVLVDRVTDATYVPIEAVVHGNGSARVYVPAGNRYRACPVQLGRSSDLYVEVLGGVQEGETVLLRAPRPEEIAPEQSAVLTASSG
jgi:hypothetical protein